MDNHPIPQDVTGFQFKLIGNMTVKQFAYLASGVVFAWIFFQLPINFLIKLPFCAFSAVLGIGLAFFPVSGRPMDLMIGNFIKALIRPTQFVYEKTGGQLYYPHKTTLAVAKQYKSDLNPFPKDKLKLYLESLDKKQKSKVDEKENNFLMSVSNLATNNVSYQTPVISIPSTPNIQKLSPILEPPKSAYPMQAAVQPAQVIVQPAQQIPTPMSIASPKIEKIKPLRHVPNIGMPSVPEFPNLITGITKDPRGNALSNILVEVKDKEGNPVRAFKTNELGRFASATPLINGTYAIEFEDPKGQNKFEKIMINVTGQIILPIEVVSIDTREELRRSLFSTSN